METKSKIHVTVQPKPKPEQTIMDVEMSQQCL